MQRFLYCTILIISLLGIVSCKPGIPRKYLQPNKMADIMYDYHIAEALQSVHPAGDTMAVRAYHAYILKKYKVSQADFDSSLVYYTRHTKLLEDVYDKIAERLNNESALYGGSQLTLGDEITNNSDTTNIWQASPVQILSPYLAFNRKTFEIKADTSYHEGDKIILDFDTKFIYQDGMRDGVAVLAVTYSNDSVEVVSNSLMSSAHYHLQINNAGRLKIKSIRGFFLHNNTQNQNLSSRTTLKMLLITNIKLIRMHTKRTEPSNDNQSDSITFINKDSILLKKTKQPLMLKPKRP